MEWLLLFWIQECVGLKCPIPDFEMREFATEPECNTELEFWLMTGPKTRKGQHIGICHTANEKPKKVEIWKREQ